MLVCMIAHTPCLIAHMRGRLCVAEPEKLRSRVRLRLFCHLCAFAVNAHKCVAETRSPWSEFCCVGVSADTCLLRLGSLPIMVHTHVCFVRKEQLLQSFAWMCQPIHLFVLQNASCYLGPFHLTVHTHVCCRSQDWRSQLPFAVLALVAVYEYARTCAGRGKQSAVSVPATAIG